MTKHKFEYTSHELNLIRKVKSDIKGYINTLVFYMNYEASKKGQVGQTSGLLNNGILAGGAIASLLQDKTPNDLDIYLPVGLAPNLVEKHELIIPEKAAYSTGLAVADVKSLLWHGTIPEGYEFLVTDYLISSNIFNSAIKGLTNISPLRKDVKVQFIFTRKTPKEYINEQFPYVHQLGQYNLKEDNLSFSPKTYMAIGRCLLSPNPNANNTVQNRATDNAQETKYIKEYNYYFISENEMENVMRAEIEERQTKAKTAEKAAAVQEYVDPFGDAFYQDIADEIRNQTWRDNLVGP